MVNREEEEEEKSLYFGKTREKISYFFFIYINMSFSEVFFCLLLFFAKTITKIKLFSFLKFFF